MSPAAMITAMSARAERLSNPRLGVQTDQSRLGGRRGCVRSRWPQPRRRAQEHSGRENRPEEERHDATFGLIGPGGADASVIDVAGGSDDLLHPPFPGTVADAVHHEIDRRRERRSDESAIDVPAGQQRQDAQLLERLRGGARVYGAGTGDAGVEREHQIERLGVAHLTDHQPIRRMRSASLTRRRRVISPVPSRLPDALGARRGRGRRRPTRRSPRPSRCAATRRMSPAARREGSSFRHASPRRRSQLRPSCIAPRRVSATVAGIMP